MKPVRGFEYPPEQQRAYRRAKRLAWITLGYMFTVNCIMVTVLGQSQAMKTVWIEDLLSMIPSAVFLIASRIYDRPPSERYPYGRHRVVSIAFLIAATALFAMGVYLLVESVLTLIKREHPTVGSLELFGHTVWIGWLAFPALLYSGLPAVVLGRLKKPLAAKLNDKVLHADATMNADDWLTAAAGLVGMFGIGMGWWWMDAAAAGLISFAIIRDGWTHLRDVISHLMNKRPDTVDGKKPDPLPEQVAEYLRGLSWVSDAEVRMREEGHVYLGEAFVVPARPMDACELMTRLDDAVEGAKELHWKVLELVIMPVKTLEEDSGAGAEEGEKGAGSGRELQKA